MVSKGAGIGYRRSKNPRNGASFDWGGFLYVVKFVFVFIAFFIAGQGIIREIPELFIVESPELIFNLALSKAPVYRKLPEGAILFSAPERVKRTKHDLIARAENFIYADISVMALSVYRNGKVATSVPINAIGKEGSFFETPNGQYKILSKEKNHFSTIGSVWMPWSMNFFGNYFIHGWPYYPGGKAVADSFSGGCIRLTTENAKEIFDLAEKGETVLVYDPNAPGMSDFTYFEKIKPGHPRVRVPDISAVSALAADTETGEILFAKNKTEIHPIASITKLMTGLVALETINRFKTLAMDSASLSAYGNSAGLKAGEKLTSEEFLYPLMLASSNDVAELYKRTVPGFIGVMNEKARAIGLQNTFYEDPSGMSPKNVSTAEDLFKLLTYIQNSKKPLFNLTALPSKTLVTSGKSRKHMWNNVNWPADDEQFVGGKAGLTDEALQTMAGIYRVHISEFGDREVAIIVLGSYDRVKAVRAIIGFLEKQFVYGSVIAKVKQSHVIEAGANVYEALKYFR